MATIRQPTEQQVREIVDAGVGAVLPHDGLTPEKLVACVRAVVVGTVALPGDLLARLLASVVQSSHLGPGSLNDRERSVLRLLADGHDTRGIAEDLRFSERTVKNVVHDVLTKLNCRTRAQAVALATREGAIQPMAESWAVLADLLLQREALVCRVAEGRPPRDFAGLYVSADDLGAVLKTLPGVDGPSPEAVEPMRATFAEQIATAREAFAADLRAGCRSPPSAGRRPSTPRAPRCSPFWRPSTSAARQRLVAYLQDSVHFPQLTPAAWPGSSPNRATRPSGPSRPTRRCGGRSSWRSPAPGRGRCGCARRRPG